MENENKTILFEWYNGTALQVISQRTGIEEKEIKYFIEQNEKTLLSGKKEKIRNKQNGFTRWIDQITKKTLNNIRK